MHKSSLKLPTIAAPFLLLLAAGCGAVSSASLPSAGGVVVSADKASLDTTTTDQLSARLGSGAPVSVKWTIVGGQNDPSLGQGSISANGSYSPPPLLSRDQVQIQLAATSQSDPAATGTYVLTVTPGFLQVLSPETASLAPGGTVQVTGEIAEVNAGSIHWSLATTAGGEIDPGDSYGSIGETRCSHSARSYTSCTATYTAPRALPPGSPSVYVVGLAAGNARSAAALHVLLNGAGFNSSGLQNQAAQTGYVEMGSSGGNANDYDSKQDGGGKEYVNDCCGGTLGALVTDRNSNLFILSNNHVLPSPIRRAAGTRSCSPALVDLNCNPQAGRSVGSLRYVVPIQSSQTNVDAALAAATPAVDSSGAILQLGPSVDGVLSPGGAGGGHRRGADREPAESAARGQEWTHHGIDLLDGEHGQSERAGGLLLRLRRNPPPITPRRTSTRSACPASASRIAETREPWCWTLTTPSRWGYFFASGADDSNHGFSVANPIQEVLSELGQTSHIDGMQIAGGAPHPITCSNYDERTPPATRAVSPARMAAAKSAIESAAATALLAKPDNGILGLAAGQSQDSPGRPQ